MTSCYFLPGEGRASATKQLSRQRKFSGIASRAPLVCRSVNNWHMSCEFGIFMCGDTAMPMGRPKADLVLDSAELAQLQSMVRSRSIPAALRARAQIVLASANGEANSSIAARFGYTNATVGKWRRRFVERRISGLYDELRPGKPRSIDDERVAELIQTTLHSKPTDGATHWSVRSLAAETGISSTSVHRYIKLFGLQPHRSESFKLSTDPFFLESRVM